MNRHKVLLRFIDIIQTRSTIDDTQSIAAYFVVTARLVKYLGQIFDPIAGLRRYTVLQEDSEMEENFDID